MEEARTSAVRETASPIGVDLEAFRVEAGHTYGALAVLIGARSPRQARAWALGHERPSAEATDRILKATKGRVSVHAMHLRRLQYEREHVQHIEPIVPEEEPRSLVPRDGHRPEVNH